MNVCWLGLIFWSSGVSLTLLEKGVFVTKGKKGYVIPAIGQGVLAVDFYPDDRVLRNIKDGKESCFGNTIHQSQKNRQFGVYQ